MSNIKEDSVASKISAYLFGFVLFALFFWFYDDIFDPSDQAVGYKNKFFQMVVVLINQAKVGYVIVRFTLFYIALKCIIWSINVYLKRDEKKKEKKVTFLSIGIQLMLLVVSLLLFVFFDEVLHLRESSTNHIQNLLHSFVQWIYTSKIRYTLFRGLFFYLALKSAYKLSHYNSNKKDKNEK